jgi:CDP-diacylglycerol--glycerol-3-phosphate 3-phosphatidyltransferase
MSLTSDAAPAVLERPKAVPPPREKVSTEIWNLPNSLTLFRIFLVPLLVVVLLTKYSNRLGLAIFLVAAVTDFLDGYFARRMKKITRLGALLDPIADKLLITSAYVALIGFNPHVVKPWIVVVVIGREFLVSGLRSIASTEGFTIEASDVGKLKTVIQIVSVVAATLDHGWYAWHFGWFIIPVHLFAAVGIYYTAAVSIVSAVDYFVAFWRKIDKAAAKQRTSDNEFVLSRRKKKTTPPAAQNVAQP